MNTTEKLAENSVKISAVLSSVLIIVIFIFVFHKSIPVLQHDGLSFFTTKMKSWPLSAHQAAAKQLFCAVLIGCVTWFPIFA